MDWTEFACRLPNSSAVECWKLLNCFTHMLLVMSFLLHYFLTRWGRVTHICVSKLTSTASDNGLSPDRRQAIIWTNTGLLVIIPLGTNFSENLIAILTFSFRKMRLKMSSAIWRTFCLGLNVLMLDTCCASSILHMDGRRMISMPLQMADILETIYSEVFCLIFWSNPRSKLSMMVRSTTDQCWRK